MAEFTLREYTEKEYYGDLKNLLSDLGLEKAVESKCDEINDVTSSLGYVNHRYVQELMNDILELIRIYGRKYEGTKDWNADENTELCKFDGVSETTVYAGFADCLEKVNLEWRKVFVEEAGEEMEFLTLKEIAEQCEEKNIGIITVFCEGMLGGNIYQYGNYADGKWVNYGETRGGA